MNCIVLLILSFVSLNAFLSMGQIMEITGEDVDYMFEDYGDEELLWGKELSPQWCESPIVNSTLGDRVTLRSFFIEANSKGQYATETVAEVSCGSERRLKLEEGVIHPLSSVHLRCTLNSSGSGGIWLLIGSGGAVTYSNRPGCAYGNPTFHICELPHLIHRGLSVNATKNSRFFRHNDTLIVRCALAQNTLHPPGKHTLRCINSQWVYEVNDVPSGLKYPNCATRSICTTRQIPHFLDFITNGINCKGKSTSCLSPKTLLPLGTKLELRCKDDTTRLIGPSSVVCLNSASHSGSGWYPPKWPSCIPKLTCPEPFIQKGAYITSNLSSATFRRGMQVWFKCWEGYILYGSEMIVCLKSGLWNDSFPECIADENGVNEDSITVLLFVLTCCLSVILVIMFRAVYRQNQWLKHRHESTASATEEMLLKTMNCSITIDYREANDAT
uniref:Bm11051 n=2 Tax=Brugia malayi TaxID=6279 RepID=A0A0H5SCM8_BRUMA|nr:Bm11051 [Brugia malayi]